MLHTTSYFLAKSLRAALQMEVKRRLWGQTLSDNTAKSFTDTQCVCPMVCERGTMVQFVKTNLSTNFKT